MQERIDYKIMLKKLSNFLSRFYIFIIFLFLYAPILVLMVFSFNDSKSMSVWKGFTLKWYGELLNDQRILQALYYTLLIAIISSVVATIIGTISAIGISKMRGPMKRLILNINYLPVLNPDIVTGIGSYESFWCYSLNYPSSTGIYDFTFSTYNF